MTEKEAKYSILPERWNPHQALVTMVQVLLSESFSETMVRLCFLDVLNSRSHIITVRMISSTVIDGSLGYCSYARWKANDKSQEAGEHKFILFCAKVLLYHYAEK